MSKWLKLGTVVAAVAFAGLGCGDEDKCKNVTCDTGQTCNPDDGVCRPGSTGNDSGTKTDSGVDSGTMDAGNNTDGGNDTDGGNNTDGGNTDAGVTACDMDKIVTLNGNLGQDGIFQTYAGTTDGAPSSIEPPAGCQQDGQGNGTEVVHQFNLPIRADVFLSTDNATTTLDTVLYVNNTCTTGVASESLDCNDDVADGVPVSNIFPNSLDAGTYFITVDSANDQASGAYQLDMFVRPVSALGGICDATQTLGRCQAGLTCGPANTCITATAPTITSLKAFSTSLAEDGGIDGFRLVVEGTDPDKDVAASNEEGGYLVRFIGADGGVVAAGTDTDFGVAFSSSVYGQSPFTGVTSLRGLSDVGFNDAPVGAQVIIFDSAGLQSTPASATFVEFPNVPNGDPCDVTGANNGCAAMEDYCVPANPGDLTGTCTTDYAPTTDLVVAYKPTDGGTASLVVTGTDLPNDILGVAVNYIQPDGGDLLLSDGGTLRDLLLFSEYIGTTTVTGIARLRTTNTNARAQASVGVKVAVLDGNLNATEPPVEATWTLPPVRTNGSTCDALRWNDSCAPEAPACGVTSGMVPTCSTVEVAATAACNSAIPLMLGTPVTGTAKTGADIWSGECDGTTPTATSGGSEIVYSFTISETSDVVYSTAFPETTADTVVYIASNCGPMLDFKACSDDVNQQVYSSAGTVNDLPAGTYYVFVDYWKLYSDAGALPYKLLVNTRPVINTAGTACDLLEIENRCGGSLLCKPNDTYTAYSCE